MFGRPRRPHEETGRRACLGAPFRSLNVPDTVHPVAWIPGHSRIHHEQREMMFNETTSDESVMKNEPRTVQNHWSKERGYIGGLPERSVDTGRLVMDAPRPVRGNNFFGGKQKTYKVTSSGTFGRQIYDDLESLSPFQRHCRAERRAKKTGQLDEDGHEPGISTPAIVLSESAAEPSTRQHIGTTDAAFTHKTAVEDSLRARFAEASGDGRPHSSAVTKNLYGLGRYEYLDASCLQSSCGEGCDQWMYPRVSTMLPGAGNRTDGFKKAVDLPRHVLEGTHLYEDTDRLLKKPRSHNSKSPSTSSTPEDSAKEIAQTPGGQVPISASEPKRRVWDYKLGHEALFESSADNSPRAPIPGAPRDRIPTLRRHSPFQPRDVSSTDRVHCPGPNQTLCRAVARASPTSDNLKENKPLPQFGDERSVDGVSNSNAMEKSHGDSSSCSSSAITGTTALGDMVWRHLRSESDCSIESTTIKPFKLKPTRA